MKGRNLIVQTMSKDTEKLDKRSIVDYFKWSIVIWNPLFFFKNRKGISFQIILS